MSAELTASEILSRARQVYATCLTYRDEGVVATRFVPLAPGGHAHSDRKPFWTAFVRPDRFRFEWAEATVGPEDEWDRMLILWNEVGVRSSWTIQPGIRDHESVHEAISCATGVSGGSAYTVPTLLMPGEKRGEPFPAPENVTLLGRARTAGHECFRLAEAGHRGRQRILWIGCDDSLLWRLDEEQMFDEEVSAEIRRNIEEHVRAAATEEERKARARVLEEYDHTSCREFRTETTTTYEPLVDAPIGPETFVAPDSWSESARATPAEPRLVPTVLAPPGASAPPVAEILARVRRVYAACKTFRDSGKITTVTLERARPRTGVEVFSIAFARPDRLRFEHAHPTIGPPEEWIRGTYLRNEDGVSWCVEPEGRLSAAKVEDIARFGQTFVPVGLLVVGPMHLDPLPSEATAVLLGIEALEGQECFVVRGRPPGREERTLWIGCDDSFVRRSVFTNVYDERWYREQREHIEASLRLPLPEQERRAMERALEHFSRPQEPYRDETTIQFAPVPDAELPPGTFETPAAWR